MKRISFAVCSLLILVFGFTSFAFSVYKMRDLKRKGFGGVLVGALYNFGISEVNEALGSYGFPKFGDVSLGLGGMGFGVLNSGVVIGGAGLANMPSTTEAKINGTNVSAVMSGGYGFFEVGYSVINSDSFVFAPILGLGGGGTELVFSVKDDKSYDFDEIVRNPITREFGVGYGGFGLELGVLALFAIKTFEKEKSYNEFNVRTQGAFGVGLKVSYFYIFQVNDPSVMNEPKYSGHNVFASLIISWGGFSELKRE